MSPEESYPLSRPYSSAEKRLLPETSSSLPPPLLRGFPFSSLFRRGKGSVLLAQKELRRRGRYIQLSLLKITSIRNCPSSPALLVKQRSVRVHRFFFYLTFWRATGPLHSFHVLSSISLSISLFFFSIFFLSFSLSFFILPKGERSP